MATYGPRLLPIRTGAYAASDRSTSGNSGSGRGDHAVSRPRTSGGIPRRFRVALRLGAALALILAQGTVQAQTVWYVDASADQEPHDGSTWRSS